MLAEHMAPGVAISGVEMGPSGDFCKLRSPTSFDPVAGASLRPPDIGCAQSVPGNGWNAEWQAPQVTDF